MVVCATEENGQLRACMQHVKHMKISKVALYVLGTCCEGLSETSTRAGGQLAKAQDWRAGWGGVGKA